jgi:hypothetical protein
MNVNRSRLRAPLLMLALGSASAAIFGVVQGWTSAVGIEALVVVIAVIYYVGGGRDGDVSALVRGQPDERQASVRTRAQALVGKVMSVAVVAAFLIAVVVRTTIWPFEILVILAGVTFFVGLAIYR